MLLIVWFGSVDHKFVYIGCMVSTTTNDGLCRTPRKSAVQCRSRDPRALRRYCAPVARFFENKLCGWYHRSLWYSGPNMSESNENGEVDHSTRLLDSTTKKISASADLGKQKKTGKTSASVKYKIIPQNADVKSTYNFAFLDVHVYPKSSFLYIAIVIYIKQKIML